MRTTARTVALGLVVMVSVAALSACSLLGPARDSDGRVTETTKIDSTTLTVGDCFSFVDGTDLAEANVTPCAKDHTYIVIGDGTLSPSEVDTAGGMQNAVSGACSENFTAFKDAAPEGTKPEQQFIVSPQEKDGKSFTLYLCVATDSPAKS